jgi:hypothetical protein
MFAQGIGRRPTAFRYKNRPSVGRPVGLLAQRSIVLCQRLDFGFMSISEHSVFVCRRTTYVFGGRAASSQFHGLTQH